MWRWRDRETIRCGIDKADEEGKMGERKGGGSRSCTGYKKGLNGR